MGMFDGRGAVVTGGASGIGAATCRAFAAEGARVAVVDVDGDGAAAVAAEVGAGASVHPVDVTDAVAVLGKAADVRAAHGAVDVLVNNVGDWLEVRPFHLGTPGHWDRLLDVNLRQVFLVTHAFLGGMVDRGRGVRAQGGAGGGHRARHHQHGPGRL